VKIGELSRLTGVSIASIRLYERERLIGPAARTAGRLRIFSDEQMRRLAFIKRARNLGFSLEDVKKMLALSDVDAIHGSVGVIEQLRTAIASRLTDLQALDECLASDLGKGLRDIEGCFSRPTAELSGQDLAENLISHVRHGRTT
jgi:MerR family transcriptional regulator, copper efflux regulator